MGMPAQGYERRIIPSRWILPYQYTSSIASETAIVARVYLIEFEVLTPNVANAISIPNGATRAGNAIVGIYGPLVTEETCLSAPLVIQSASTPVAGIANTPQIIPITSVLLKPGRYYAAVEYSDVTNNYFRSGNVAQVPGWMQSYDMAGAIYGPLTDPCPAVAATLLAVQLKIRCDAK